ncbi:amino acid ABC transporter substrate-binding protein [Arachnia propionica]|uniref:Amino acid ABC transporter substrate-binding protein n=1 Tax=Arachnia propionica TaxID=1750 RepID=A0A3P1T9S9_9ACTN|nr:ABC transporter substrate-binding protein [Arachnia propionica]RRD05935.1 amino acid ABC transporter substrate-binding protein [Arachnia propionica]
MFDRHVTRWPGRRTHGVFALLLAGMLCVGCTGQEPDPEPSFTPVAAPPQPVALTAEGLPEKVRIGVIVTLSSAPGEGADWPLAAEGARVAAERFQMGGHDVEIVVADDRGTPAGSSAAVDELVTQGVSGIVLATSGTHVVDAIAAARTHDTAVLLPYLTEDRYLADGAWATGLLRSTHDEAFHQTLEVQGGSHVIQVTAPGSIKPLRFAPQDEVYFDPGAQDHDEFLKELTEAAAEGADTIVILGDATTSALATAAVRSSGLGLPIILTNAATSPTFSTTLLETTGSLNGTYWTVGLPTDDPAGSRPDATGSSVTAFLNAIHSTAQNPEATRYFEQSPFSDVAYAADAASHDATVALVTAAAQAGSSDPKIVLATLPGMSATHDHGLVGPSLNFSRPAALVDGGPVPLVGTTDHATERPGQGPMLRWFEAARGS